MTDAQHGGRPRLALASALLAPIVLIGGWVLAQAAQPAGYDARVDSLSALAALDTPHRSIMTTAFVLTGLCHSITAYAVPRLPIAARLLLGLGGWATIAVAALPLPGRTGGSPSHVVAASLALVALAIWPAFGIRRDGTWPQRRWIARGAAGVLFLGVVLTGVATQGGPIGFGLVERVTVAGQALWPLVLATSTWWAAGRPIGSGPVRVALGGAVLVVVAATGGVAATVLAPTTVQTTYYEAHVSLRLDPFASNTLRASTVLGDLTLGFSGLAPGIDAHPEIKASITDALAKSTPSVRSLTPTPAELDRAVRSAAVTLAWRFALGGLLASLAVAALVTLARSRTGSRLRWLRVGGAGLLATAIALAATGAGLAATYRPERQDEIASTGLLGLVQQNRDLLTNVEARANQATPYLRNLLALSQALQDKYAPTAIGTTAAARILLVSDIHAGNQYALMRTIIEQEGITAVIDSGDIVNFGHVEELAAADITKGIESLKVPYIFVRGNHDAFTAEDTGILDRLAQVPNVVLLQPSTQQYEQVNVNGIRVAGFNDPRWYGDSDTDNAAKQQPPRAQFEATFRGRADLPDIVVSHEPAAVRGLGIGAILVNGHMHTADREGNRLQVGTFTGGGPWSHFNASESGAELTGQPSAFDVLAFGGDCRLQSVTRYAFRNIVEGRPAYDTVSLLSGTSLVGPARPGAAPRTCGAAPLQQTTIAAIAPTP